MAEISGVCSAHYRGRRVRAWYHYLLALMMLGTPSFAAADCIVQDGSGLTRAVLLGEGRARVTMVLRGEVPPPSELQLRRVTGLAAVVAGRLEKSTAIFSGVSDGTWQISLSTSQISSISIERPEGNLPPLQSPTSSPQNGG